jgi:hypothetical protein
VTLLKLVDIKLELVTPVQLVFPFEEYKMEKWLVDDADAQFPTATHLFCALPIP